MVKGEAWLFAPVNLRATAIEVTRVIDLNNVRLKHFQEGNIWVYDDEGDEFKVEDIEPLIAGSSDKPLNFDFWFDGGPNVTCAVMNARSVMGFYFNGLSLREASSFVSVLLLATVVVPGVTALLVDRGLEEDADNWLSTLRVGGDIAFTPDLLVRRQASGSFSYLGRDDSWLRTGKMTF